MIFSTMTVKEKRGETDICPHLLLIRLFLYSPSLYFAHTFRSTDLDQPRKDSLTETVMQDGRDKGSKRGG